MIEEYIGYVIFAFILLLLWVFKLFFALNNEKSQNTKLSKEINDLKDKFIKALDDFNHEKQALLNDYEQKHNDLYERFKNSYKELLRKNKYLTKRNETLENISFDDFVPQDEQYEKILDAIKKGENIFITGGAGVGKSYILNKLKEHFKSDLELTATTGVAAVNIGGMTIHSFCGIADLKPHQIINSILNDEKKTNLKNKIRGCKMLAIDEISMASAYLLEYIDKVLKGVRGNDLPFGGIQIIAVGDFFQLPPVIKKGEQCEYKNVCNCILDLNEQDICKKRKYVFNSELLKKFQIINLTEIKRQEDKVFSTVLNRLRYGRNISNAKKYFNENIISQNEAILSDIIHLYSTNKECIRRNTLKLSQLNTKQRFYKAIDSFKPINEKCEIPTKKEIIKTLNKNTRAEYNLHLKIGCRVMLIHNLNVSSKLCNGAMGTVVNLDHNSVTVNFDGLGITTILPVEIELNSPDGKFIRKQIPLILAYAITIHKSQGLTLENACIGMKQIFAQGQAYVALSRLKTAKGLRIIDGFVGNNVFYDSDVLKYYLENNISS